MSERRYSREEVDAILGRAIERERGGDGLSHEELLSVAREVGVSAESLERAATEITREQTEATELLQMRRQVWRGFVSHLIPYLCVNSLLLLLNYATGKFPWALFPIVGWGIGLLFHLRAALFPTREHLEQLLMREQRRKRRREIKRELRSSAKELETAVEQGVAALLKVAAEKVSEGTTAVDRKPTARVRVNGDAATPRYRSNERWDDNGFEQSSNQPPKQRR